MSNSMGGFLTGRRSLWAWLLCAVCLPALLGAIGSATALAAETHSFDPILSLTGNCETEPVDQIPDPGCPGGEHPPKGRFALPAGIATDSHGDIYVASAGSELSGANGRIDVFDAKGNFITELPDSNGPGPMAVDSEGNLYVSNRFKETKENVVRYSPTVYKPAEGLIEYGNAPVVLEPDGGSSVMGLALESSTDRLWLKYGGKAVLLASKAEGNGVIEEFSGAFGGEGLGIAVDESSGQIYAAGSSFEEGLYVEAFELAPPHNPLFTIKKSDVPNGKFTSGGLSLAADEGTGHLLVFDGAAKKVYEFDSSGAYLATIDVNVGKAFEYVFNSAIAVDNGENSPNGAENPKGRYLYVPSGLTHAHSFAFGPPSIGSPIVESISFTGVGEEEAVLRGSIEPFGLETHYVFEYEQAEGSSGAEVAGEGDLPAGNAPVSVAAALVGLKPETLYRFRLVATNTEGSDEAAGEFSTYPETEVGSGCPNEALRTGLSAFLPDCRAYELVTPPSTNARTPRGAGAGSLGTFFASREASPQGGTVSFQIEGGSLPGAEAVGSLAGDPYRSTRGEGGWSTSYVGPNGFEAPVILPGSNSPDQGYSFWSAEGKGSAAPEGEEANYVRYPDGHSAYIGRGSLGTDPGARGKLISEGGTHIIFVSPDISAHSAVQLEPNAPPDGTQAVYDRTSDEVTHVISLLPESKTPAEGEDALYIGASLDGRGVAFEIGNTLYLRYDNQETYELGEGVTFAGIAEGGALAFYLQGGRLWRFDATTEERTEFSTGPVTPVNVSADGSTAYFVSTTVLTGEPNPNEEFAVGGEENLYRSEEGKLSFVGTVTERDVVGETVNGSKSGGLGLWAEAVGISSGGNAGRFAIDPSRTTPSGDALLFESRAALTGEGGYDPQGHVEVYRYDLAANELGCLSCNPTLAPATSDASLQSISAELGGLAPLSSFADLENLTSGGRRAIFQSSEALVPTDTDKLQDVYEWEAQGTGSCNRLGGCTYLISSGHSKRTDYLYAVSSSGGDVFLRSADLLLPQDLEETPSIYDARIDGGFPQPASEEECEGEGCRPALPPPPSFKSPAAPATGAADNVKPSGRHCPKGKRKVKRKGKVRCVKKHKGHHGKAGKKKGGRK